MSRSIFIAAALALAVTLPTVSAQAQAPRTFVSAAGSDSNPCSFAAPCRHFQAAVNATSAGGEVDALDPAGYGPITISHAITIEGQGWSYIAPPVGGTGINISAVSDGGNVSIHGVSLNGAGIAGVTVGINFNSSSRLTVTDCVVQNFSGAGILLNPDFLTKSFAITNTTFSNDVTAISFYALNEGYAVEGVIDHVVESDSEFGLDFILTANSSVNVAISNSIFNGNTSAGIALDANGASGFGVSIDNTHTTNNNTGIDAMGAVTVLLSRSVVSFNNIGVSNGTSPNLFFSYQDNRIDGNNTDISAPLNNSRALR
jgi:hypothetical protein